MKQIKKPNVKYGEVVATNQGWVCKRKGKKDELLVSFKGLKDLLDGKEVKVTEPEPETPKAEPTPAPEEPKAEVKEEPKKPAPVKKAPAKRGRKPATKKAPTKAETKEDK